MNAKNSPKNSNPNRRNFIKLGGGAVVTAALVGPSAASAALSPFTPPSVSD